MDDNSNRVKATLLGRDSNEFERVESSFTGRRGASIYCSEAAQVLSAQPVPGSTRSRITIQRSLAL